MPGVQEPAGNGAGADVAHTQHSKLVYLDYNATTPIWPEVAAKMQPFLTQHFGNPSSVHSYGQTCKAAVDQARQQVASLIHASHPDEVHFTACGTESDNWAIYGTVMAARAALLKLAKEPEASPNGAAHGVANGAAVASSKALPHVVCSAVEHPAVLKHLQQLQDLELITYTAVPCDKAGIVAVQDMVAAVTPYTALITLMHSNNEVGALQPVQELVQAIREHVGKAEHVRPAGYPPLLIHSDAAQSIGKVPVHVDTLGVDLLSVVGHKFGAPKGVAALWIKRGVNVCSHLVGGHQEAGRRAGTENVLLMVGMGEACAIAERELNSTSAHMQAMRDRLQAALLAGLPKDKVRVNGPSDPAQRLTNTLSVSILGANAPGLLSELRDQLAASAGSACLSSGHSVSTVLRAMGVTAEWGGGTFRFSTGRGTTAEEVDAAAALIVKHALASQP